jgi:hypothetical protein
MIDAAPEDEGAEVVRDALGGHGIRFEPVPLARIGLNPVPDFGSLWALQAPLLRHRPDVLFTRSWA